LLWLGVADGAAFDPERMIRTLAKHGVRYVLIGAVAGRLQGFPRLTADADITPARDQENLSRLTDALLALDAKCFTESVPEGLSFDRSPATLARADLWNLVTNAGRMALVFTPAGTAGYDDLIRNAVPFQIHGTRVDAASLVDIIRSKVAADRPQDRQDVVVLREMLRRQESQPLT